MTAKEYLQQAYHLDKLIRADQSQLDELRALATSIKSPDFSKDSVQASPQGDTVGALIAKIADLDTQIEARIDRYIDTQKEIGDAIKGVKTPLYRAVLTERYLNFKKWEQIAVDIGYTYRGVLKIHARALKSVHCFSL